MTENAARKSTSRSPSGKRSSKARGLRRKSLISAVLLGLVLLAASWVAWLDHQVRQRFEGRMWQLPAKVYARPLELYEGKRVTQQQLLYELELLAYRKQAQPPQQPGQYALRGNSFDVMTRGYRFADGEEPSRLLRIEIRNGMVSAIRDLQRQQTVAVMRFEPAYIDGIFPQHGEDRYLLELDEVPDAFLKILILTEDRRFFEHIGVDLHAIARALVVNLKAGRTVQGGSTLTQQLVKNLYLDSERSLLRKINEALMAVLLELHYDKRTILQTYINEVWLGQDRNRSIHGFGLASQYYFSKPLAQLEFDQLALLVGMVKGASYYHPVRNKQRALDRRNVILRSMWQQGLISQVQYQRLSQKDIEVTRRVRRSRYPAFMDLLKRQLKQYYDEDDLQAEGLNIYTTLDPYIQMQAEQAVSAAMQQWFANKGDLQLASVIAAHGSGDVLALIGDARPKYPGYNRALDAHRQIGSLMKPVVYLTALSEPQRYTLATVLDDSPIELSNELGDIWSPQNYDREFVGDILLFDALIQSRNVPAVKVGLDIGLGAIASTFRALGGEQSLRLLPSMTLGAIDMSPFEVAELYQTFAADGFDTPLQSVYAVTDRHGQALQRNRIEVQRKVAPAALSLVNHALMQVTREGTGRRLARELPAKVAGKTGTSDDLRDSWFAGFSGEYVAVVWMGYDDNRPTGLTGSSGALRLWSKQMQAIGVSDYPLRRDENIVTHSIDRNSGLIGGSSCENTIELPFIEGSQPQQRAACAASRSWLERLFGP